MTKKRLAAIIAAFLAGGAAFCAYLPSAAAAAKEMIEAGGKPLFELNYLTPAESAKFWLNSKGNPTMTWTLDPKAAVLKSGITDGIKYWSDMLGAGAKNPAPIQILIRTEDRGFTVYPSSEGYYFYTGDGEPSINASAEFISVLQADSNEWVKWDLETREEFARLSLQNGDALQKVVPEANPVLDPVKGKVGYLNVNIGKWLGADDPTTPHTFGWYINDKTALPENEAAADFVGTIRHEMGHALGIITQDGEVGLDNIFYDPADVEKYTKFLGDDTIYAFSDVYSPNSFVSHLIDERGNQMKPELIIADPADVPKIITVLQATGLPELVNVDENDFFYLSKTPVDGTTKGKVYFIGKNISEALDGAKFDGIDGLPVSGWEPRSGIMTTDLSHIQLQGMMSHLEYSNYTTFLEAELAVMQDIGYQLDRRDYYGASVYRDGATIINTQGYSARNADGTAYLLGVPNRTPLGVGLHIYGSRNDVTQAADILTEGTGAVGIRVDGSGNKLTVADGVNVRSDGENGIGVLVSYGKNQELNQAGTVTATGQNGRAVRFDFGSSSNGARDEYRGSYIRYTRDVPTSGDDFTISGSENLALNDELNGPLVRNFNLAGTLAGRQEAIYIGKNAFVENINILDGAKISGNIKSDWLNFDSRVYPDLKIAVGGGYEPDKYIPSLTTNLNFNAAINYDGNISGARNMRLNVAGGELNYGGKASVVSVSVANGAALSGGDYTLHYYNAAETAGGGQSGVFTNRGALAATAAGDLKIRTLDSAGEAVQTAGDSPIFISNGGSFIGYMKNDGKGVHKINIEGEASLNGAHAIYLRNALPGEKASFDEIFSATNEPESPSFNTNSVLPVSGMLNSQTVLDADGKYYATVFESDNLGERTAQEAETYEAMRGMFAQLDENNNPHKKEMRTLYNLDAPQAKEAFHAISSNELAAAGAAITQNSHLVPRIVASRLNDSLFNQSREFSPKGKVEGSGEAESNSSSVTPHSELRTPNYELNEEAWVKFSKNWGELGGADYHSSAISGGVDWKAGQNSRAGIFAAYNATSFGGSSANAELYDTRFGYYTGWENGASSAYLYADYGHTRTKTRRGLTYLGLTAEGKGSGDIFELGGEYKYDTAAGTLKTWHVSPFAGLQLSYLKQNNYSERGAGVFGQNVASMHNTYFAGELGAECKRWLDKGSYAMRLGVRRTFSGGDFDVRFSYNGYPGHTYAAASAKPDRTKGFISLVGEAELAKNWTLTGEAELQRGRRDHDILASISLRRSW